MHAWILRCNALIYSFVPLKLGTMWFYTGLVIYVAGFVPLIIAYFNNAATPSSEPVVKGVYKISRNPLYFFTALALLGVSIASASLLMMTLIILYSIFQHFIILGEEMMQLEWLRRKEKPLKTEKRNKWVQRKN